MLRGQNEKSRLCFILIIGLWFDAICRWDVKAYVTEFDVGEKSLCFNPLFLSDYYNTWVHLLAFCRGLDAGNIFGNVIHASDWLILVLTFIMCACMLVSTKKYIFPQLFYMDP